MIVRLAGAILVLGAVAGCGGDEPADEATDAATSEETTEATTEPTSEETTEPTDSATTDGTDGAGGDVEAFCAAVQALDASDNSGTSASAVAKQIETLVATTPAEVEADVTAVDENYRALLAAFDAAGVDPDTTDLTDAQVTKVQQAAAAAGYDQAAAEGAADNIKAWAGDNCEGYVPQQD